MDKNPKMRKRACSAGDKFGTEHADPILKYHLKKR
jgi:hypothetical protein